MENEGNESSAKYLLHVEGTMPVFISCQFDFNTSIVKKEPALEKSGRLNYTIPGRFGRAVQQSLASL